MTPDVAALSLLLALLIPGDEAGGQPVAGLLHHSVEFYPLDLSLPVLEVVWKFIAQEKTRKVVMYHKDQFTPYDAQFTDRLQLSNYGTKLRIHDLRMEDTGVYTAEVTFTNNEMGHESYVLTVYEPIPPPKVITETENTAERCNFTLQCSVTANISDLSYSWKSRHQDSTYQPYSSGRTLQISLPPDHQDMEIMCIVQNPADQKNVSISISVKSCSDAVQPRHQIILYVIASFIILMAVIILIIWNRKGKKKKRKQSIEEREVEYTMPEFSEPSTSSQVLRHMEILHCPNPPPQKFETLYT